MTELLAKLGIHWAQLLAQFVNFAIIAGALTFLLYKPVLRVLDERRERTRKAMADAENIENQAKNLEKLRMEAMRTLEQETGALMEEAKKNADQVSSQIIAAARKEADHLTEKARKQIEEERASMFSDVQSKLASLILRLTKEILEREFGPDDQKRLLGNLEKQIPTLLK